MKLARLFLMVGMLYGSVLFPFTTSAGAAVLTADFKINGNNVNNLVDTNGYVHILPSERLELDYSCRSKACAKVKWYVKLQGETAWKNFDSDAEAILKIHRAGIHELKIMADGFTNWLTGCYHRGEHAEKTVQLKVATNGYTQTKYPILLVPGVIGYSKMMPILFFPQNEYFYQIADAIRETSDQIVEDVSLNPWQATDSNDPMVDINDPKSRGEALALYIYNFLMDHDPDFLGDHPMKVNIIAHSHGATTSRVAIRKLAEYFPAEHSTKGSRVASLTTIAGPHYGTPTAEGAQVLLKMLGPVGGNFTQNVLKLIYEIFGAIVSAFSNHLEYIDKQDFIGVKNSFLQDEMYQFNKKYPTVALPTDGLYALSCKDPDGNPANYPCDSTNPEYTSDYNMAYGRNTTDAPFVLYEVIQDDRQILQLPLVIDNGKGEVVHKDAEDAIQYYSFSGDGPLFSSFDLFNLGLMPFTVFHLFVGYTQPTDAFIPVSSAKFGIYGRTYYWNHVDEQNQWYGNLPRKDDDGNPVDDPKEVYRMHVNKLKNAGL